MKKQHIDKLIVGKTIRLLVITMVCLLLVLLYNRLAFNHLQATSLSQTTTTTHKEVRVIVESVDALDDMDGPASSPDMYASVSINGRPSDNKIWRIEDQRNISPNWQFFEIVENSQGEIKIVLSIYDEDGFLRGDDELVDIASNAERELNLTVNTNTCAVEGDGVIGNCGATLVSQGAEDDRAAIKFRVEVKPATSVQMNLTIEGVRALEDCGFGDSILGICTDNADFYARIGIDGHEFENSSAPVEDDNDIAPDWRFIKDIDFLKGTIPLVIRIYDFDDNEDDHADLNQGSGDNLNLTIDIASCFARGGSAISGEVDGGCDVSVVSKGSGGKGTEITFRVVIEPPPSTPGTNVRCTHNPIWPKAGELVDVSAEALDGGLNSKAVGVNIEVWFKSQNAPFQSASNQAQLPASLGTFSDGEHVDYGCLVRDTLSGEVAWSGWRKIQIGQPSSEKAVPILYTGPRSSSIDIVFVADRDNYSNAEDPVFLKDVSDAIQQGYYSELAYLENQDQLNFWVASDMGLAEESDEGCDHEIPGIVLQNGYPVNVDYFFADVMAIVHRNSVRLGRFFRDCAPGGRRVFSADIANWGPRDIFLHESGHRPFGLADEYCCDGGYYQTAQFPNVYEEPENCIADIESLQTWDVKLGDTPRATSTCREIVEDLFWFFDKDWSMSDPSSNDLMVDNTVFRGADARRIDWVFQECAESTCRVSGANAALASAENSTSTEPRTDPIPELDSVAQMKSKSIIVNLSFADRNRVDENAARVLFGQPPGNIGDPPLLSVALYDDKGNTVEKYNAWHPSWEFVWGADREHRVLRSNAKGEIIFPFSPYLREMQLTDIATGTPITSVNLMPAINQFCAENPSEQDCATNLSITKSGTAEQVTAGNRFTYTVNVINYGPVGASEVMITDTLPVGVTYLDSTIPCVLTGSSTLTCNLNTVDVNETKQVLITVLANALPGKEPNRTQVLTNTIEVGQAQQDMDPSNNRASTSVQIVSNRVSNGLQVFYSFEENQGKVVHDLSDVNSPINLSIETITNTTWIKGGLTVQAPTHIASGVAATKLIDAAKSSNELTVETWIAPENTTQEGPAPIITLSNEHSTSNFALGQARWFNQPSELYDVRLRTTHTSEDGRPSTLTPNGVLTTSLTHVVYTRRANDSMAILYINGEEKAVRTVGGDFSNWAEDYHLALAGEVNDEYSWLGEYQLVAVFNRALTAEEVLQNFQAGPSDDKPITGVPVVEDLFGYVYQLWTDPAAPRAQSVTDVGIVAQRTSGKNVLNGVLVRFYNGDPSAGGVKLGDAKVDWLSPRGSAISSNIEWTVSTSGVYDIYAVIDPDNVVKEKDESNNVIHRKITVLKPAEDELAPHVDSLFINGGDKTTTQRDVILEASASDPEPGQVESIAFVEYDFNHNVGEWVTSQTGVWLPYTASPTLKNWSLKPVSGLKYMQAWARDSAGNISLYPYQQYINYMPPTDVLAESAGKFYRYEVKKGQYLIARVEPVSGDPDLYVWSPDYRAGRPAWVSNLSKGVDELVIHAPVDGVYQVEVFGYTATEYRLVVEGSDLPPTEVLAADGVDVLLLGGVDPKKPIRPQPLTPLDNIVSVLHKPFLDEGQTPDMESEVYLPLIAR